MDIKNQSDLKRKMMFNAMQVTNSGSLEQQSTEVYKSLQTSTKNYFAGTRDITGAMQIEIENGSSSLFEEAPTSKGGRSKRGRA